ncbi:MAG: twin-arginine translocase TatA/TatE family subunit [Spirochaetes bacterium]|nr:twin-arginine translocase TatA/TatE family subunit [Spirochaetota bacterium]
MFAINDAQFVLAMVGVQELLIILFIVLILFGAKKIPDLARGLGTALREFKKATKDIDIEIDDVKSDELQNKP